MRYPTCLLLSSAAVLAAVLVDTWRHPSEHWYRARYFTLGVSDPDGPQPVAADGMFAGMPLMASVSDPGNLAARGREISSGCANVVLGGPRNIRKGVELLLLSRRRKSGDAAGRAAQVLEWLSGAGPADERTVAEFLAANARLVQGFLLADELGFLARSVQDGRKTVRVR